MSGKVYILEGLPGVGKTTYGKSRQKVCSSVVFIAEEVDDKQLKLYLQDMKGKARDFQFSVQKLTTERLKRAAALAKQGKHVYVDRGLLGNACFAELQHRQGFISKEDIQRYREEFTYEGVEGLQDVECRTIYMKASASFCLTRIAARAREGENSYTLGYLEELEKLHDQVFNTAYISEAERNDIVQEGFLTNEVSLREL